MRAKKIAVMALIIGISVLLFLAGCTRQPTQEVQVEKANDIAQAPSKTSQESKTSQASWMNVKLKDVATGKEFSVSDFKGKPVLLESFAVWCPTCTKQQREIKKLHDNVGDAVVSISIDTDPNEDESQVLEYVQRNGFDWLYAVSPEDVTRALIDDFGINFVNAPQAPVVLICEDQSTRFLDRGVKNADELSSEVEKGCF